MIRNVYCSLHSIRIIKLSLSEEMKIKLVKSLVLPNLLYADAIVCCTKQGLKRKIEESFKDMIRFCFNLRKRDSTANYSKELLNCLLFDYFDYRFSVMIFKIIYFKQFEKLKFAQLERTCNLICPQVRHEANKD